MSLNSRGGDKPVKRSKVQGITKSVNDKKVAKNVAKALAEVPIDNKQER